MNQSSESVAQAADTSPNETVAHDEDGYPRSSDGNTSFDRPDRYDMGGGNLVYEGRMGGAPGMGGGGPSVFTEPLGAVSDKRLRDLYRFEAKRAYSTGSDRYEERAEWLREFVEARGLSIPDVTDWYVVYLSMVELETVKQEFTGIWTWANRVDDGETHSPPEEQEWCLRCTEEEAAFVEETLDADPVPLDETDVAISEYSDS